MFVYLSASFGLASRHARVGASLFSCGFCCGHSSSIPADQRTVLYTVGSEPPTIRRARAWPAPRARPRHPHVLASARTVAVQSDEYLAVEHLLCGSRFRGRTRCGCAIFWPADSFL